MYPGVACNKFIPSKKTEIFHFKENEDDHPIGNTTCVCPSVNISETKTEYHIIIATPGLHREDFNIEIDECILTISAKKETIPVDTVIDRCEYDLSEWTRAFILPDDADELLAHAQYKNGELTIHIPRSNTSENQAKATIYVY
jgi:HSP20 family protein